MLFVVVNAGLTPLIFMNRHYYILCLFREPKNRAYYLFLKNNKLEHF